jgi:hypothetical protein
MLCRVKGLAVKNPSASLLTRPSIEKILVANWKKKKL